MVRPLVATLVVLVLAVVPAQAARDLPGRIGMYPQQGAPLAMLDSDVALRVRGPIVEAVITQTFKNDTDRVTEATYIFPLPPDAAVTAMELEVGNRTIRAAIERRDQAVQRYERAVAAGLGAGLLEQERPDVFTQTVSAIPARGTVTVTLRVDTVARYQDGRWELALPLVVAPRYVPGSASGRPTTGAGRSPDTDRAPDASRVTPPTAPGAGGRTDVALEFGEAVDDVTCTTHELTGSGDRFRITDPRTDHDMVIRWRSKVAQHAWVEAGDGGGFAAVLVEARPASVTARKTAIKLALLLDHAATVRGDAETVQRPTVRALLGALDARDQVGLAGPDSIAWSTPASAQRTLDEKLPASGPFDLSKRLAALKTDTPVVLISDGLVADDRAVVAAAAKLKAPVHVIGIGPAPNRGLLQQLAHATGGTVRFAAIGDDLAALARDVIADIATPPEPLSITWGTLAATDVVPASLPRLGAGQATLVVARVKKVQAANARARGDVFGFASITPVKAPDGATTTLGVLGRRWAKLRLDDLIRTGTTSAIAEHALRHGLVSPATAMVAIGEETIERGGVKHSTQVPVSVPAGMQWQLVKKQTTVETATTTTTRDSVGARDRVADHPAKNKRPVGERPVGGTAGGGASGAAAPEPEGGEGVDALAKGEDEDRRTTRDADYAAPVALAPAPADADDEYDRAESISLASESMSSRRIVRLTLALGAGIAVTGGEPGVLGGLSARIEAGRRTLVGLEGSAWLVDGLDAEGSLLATLARRGVARRFELGAGLGLRFTGDALGPALGVSLRILLPVRGLAAFLRYDGALLRASGDDASVGQNTGAFGFEARW